VRPAYWDDACKHLTRKDRVMKRLIAQSDGACLQTRGDAFTTLARSIVGQQISVKAAQTVWDRFAQLPRKMTPANVLKLKVDDMRARRPVGAQGRVPGRPVAAFQQRLDPGRRLGGDGRRSHHCRTGRNSRHRPLDGRDVPDLPPDAAQCAAAGRRGPDQRHQPQLFFRRDGQPQRRARGGRCLDAYCSVATWYIWRSLDPLPVEY
jgi:DNA-3-methyladenine glycosylase II